MNLGEIAANGLWKQNPGLIQLLGLCPLLAISSSVVNAASLGLATMLVMTLASGAVSSVRHLVPSEIRIPVYIFIIAVLVTIVDLMFNAFAYSLYLVLGIFIPLIVTNCIVLARAESFASKNRPLPAILDGAMQGFGLALVLVTLGSFREILGHGTLLSGIDLALGPQTRDWVITILPEYHGFLLAVLPPGAFIGLGLIIAVRNHLQARAERKAPATASVLSTP
jgi:H+/Na+-translocating ferredoxin:NAD+ oxidoreductase subunit E